jgi:hypothetical protein
MRPASVNSVLFLFFALWNVQWRLFTGFNFLSLIPGTTLLFSCIQRLGELYHHRAKCNENASFELRPWGTDDKNNIIQQGHSSYIFYFLCIKYHTKNSRSLLSKNITTLLFG